MFLKVLILAAAVICAIHAHPTLFIETKSDGDEGIAGEDSAVSEVPTAPSEEPTTPSEEPTTPSEEPTTPSEEPTTPSQEPTTPSEEPTTPSEEPTTPSEEPTTPSEEPTTPSEEPTTPSEEPTTPSEEPTTPSEEPTTASQEPTTPSEEPTTPSEEPTTPSEEPTTPSEEPTTPSEEPTTPSEEPTTPSEEPTTPSEEPTTPSEEPTTPSEEPTTPSQEPTTPSEEPTTPSEEPPTEPTTPAPEDIPNVSIPEGAEKKCILATLDFNVTINYKNNDDADESRVVGIPAERTTNGACAGETVNVRGVDFTGPILVYSWDWSTEKVKAGNSFNYASVTFTNKTMSKVEANILIGAGTPIDNAKDSFASLSVDLAERFKAPEKGGSFRCSKIQNVEGDGGSVTFSNVHFEVGTELEPEFTQGSKCSGAAATIFSLTVLLATLYTSILSQF